MERLSFFYFLVLNLVVRAYRDIWFEKESNTISVLLLSLSLVVLPTTDFDRFSNMNLSFVSE